MRLLLLQTMSLLLDGLFGPPPPPGDRPLPDLAFVLPSGSHDSRPGTLVAYNASATLDRHVSFRAFFGDDVAYTTVDPANQFDWNKLMGMTAVNIHGDSLRLGWRYNLSTGLVDLGLYAYVDGVRVDVPIKSVAPRTWFSARLTWTEAALEAEVDGVRVSVPGPGPGLPWLTWAMTTAYFGGDETAPHDIHIWVQDGWTDR